METVEVMIKIPKNRYETLVELNERIKNKESIYKLGMYENAIANGTVLPEGHGRLFILDEELAKKYFTEFSFSCQKWISEVGISEATLKVIESNKEVSECFSTNQI